MKIDSVFKKLNLMPAKKSLNGKKPSGFKKNDGDKGCELSETKWIYMCAAMTWDVGKCRVWNFCDVFKTYSLMETGRGEKKDGAL